MKFYAGTKGNEIESAESMDVQERSSMEGVFAKMFTAGGTL